MTDPVAAGNMAEARNTWVELIKSHAHPYPLGNGTGSSNPPPEHSIKLYGELAGIRWVDMANRQVTAGCGTTLGELNAELAGAGLRFPAMVFDPAQVTLGGWLGSGMPGADGRILPARRLLAATMLTPQSRLVHSGASTPKDVAGYDFHRPLVGAHGRLGMLLEVTLAVEPQPAQKQFLQLVFCDLRRFFTILTRCKTVQRLWITDNSNGGITILLEQHGETGAIKEEGQKLELAAQGSEMPDSSATELWGKMLKEAFKREGYYLCWSLATAQACAGIAGGGWWGNPWEGKIWRYLGTDEPPLEPVAGKVTFAGRGGKLYPCMLPSRLASDFYIATV